MGFHCHMRSCMRVFGTRRGLITHITKGHKMSVRDYEYECGQIREEEDRYAGMSLADIEGAAKTLEKLKKPEPKESETE